MDAIGHYRRPMAAASSVSRLALERFARIKVMVVVVLIALGGTLPRTGAAMQSVALGWDASPDLSVVGYVVYWGSATGEYDSRLDVFTNTAATITGLVEGTTYYFVVKSYNAAGLESSPSNEVRFIAPGLVQIVSRARSLSPAHIAFPILPGLTYRLEASSDLKTWTQIWQVTGTENTWVEYLDTQSAVLPRRFYRVHSLVQ
jgi:fibronectin type III domain protein